MTTPVVKPCSFPACDRIAKTRGLCVGHYSQALRGGGLRALGLPKPIRPVVICQEDPSTAIVSLTKGMVALIDSCDAASVGARTWHAVASRPGTAYAAANITVDGRGTTIELHRFLWREWMLADTQTIDHVDGDGLNCRRINLRPATQSENMRNRGRNRNSASGAKGVSWSYDLRRWTAQIGLHGRLYRLGSFDDRDEAAAAYTAAAMSMHGCFAKIEHPRAIEQRPEARPCRDHH